MKELNHLMGQIVTVHKELIMTCRYSSASRKCTIPAEVDIEPRAGWVTGWRNIPYGETHYSYEYDQPYGHSKIPQFEQRGVTPCLLVVFWPNRNPVRVPLDGYELGGEPYPDRSGEVWTEELREWQKQIVQGWPRDEAGRWLPLDK